MSVVAALKDLSNAEDIASKFKTLFITFSLPNLYLNVFGAKNSPVGLINK